MASAMWYGVLSVLVGVSYAMVLEGVENIDDKFEPLVAFKCGYASNYLTRAGWLVDHSQSCLSNAEDIMAYCSTKYPKLKITNVIPSPSEIEANWTVANESRIEKFHVRPYRCIVGEFDSDALVVPDGCLYATSLPWNSTRCASYFDWNSTAHDNCALDQLELYSFGVVRPCGVGMFHHMEYVCCSSASISNAIPINEPSRKLQPSPKSSRPSMQRSTLQPVVSTTSLDYESDYVYEEDQFNDWYDASVGSETDEEDYEDAYQYDEYTIEEDEPYEQEFEDGVQYEDDEYFTEDENSGAVYLYEDEDYDPTKNYFQIYMETPKQLGNTENEIYAKAVRYVKRYYDGQKQLLLKQLAEADIRASDLKNKSAAKLVLTADISTIRDLYESTEKTWNSVKNSMLEEHSKRLAKDLQSEREVQSEAWKNATRQLKPNSTIEDITQLLSVLRQYVNAEENERIFWINHYEALLKTNSMAALSLRQVVKASLRANQLRLKSVIEALKRDGVSKSVVDSVQAILNDYLKNYTDLDNEVQSLFPDSDSTTESSTTDELGYSVDDGDSTNLNEEEIMLKAPPSDYEETNSAVSDEKPVMMIVMVSAGAFVLVLVLVSAVVLVCSLRKRKSNHANSPRSRRHAHAHSLHHALFLVPDATKHGSLEPLHLGSDARRILVDMPPSPRQSVYAQTTHTSERRIRGHDNPLNNFAGIVFSDSAPLVEHDMLNEDVKHVA